MSPDPVLLIDTCEERASVALCRATAVIEQRTLPERKASASLADDVDSMLRAHAITPGALRCVGVVSGPGSFTGVRIGLAFAKGLCLATSVPLVTVSRLAVLAQATACDDCLAVVDAGRQSVYLRDSAEQSAGRERMLSNQEADLLLRGRAAIFGSSEVAQRFASVAASVVELTAGDALPLVLARLVEGGNELETSDANYVRDEAAIYRRLGSERSA